MDDNILRFSKHYDRSNLKVFSTQYFAQSVAKNQKLQQFNTGTFKNCKETIIVESCQTSRVKQNKRSTTLFFWGHEDCKAILKLDPNDFQDVLNLFMRYHARFCYTKSHLLWHVKTYFHTPIRTLSDGKTLYPFMYPFLYKTAQYFIYFILM